MTEKGNYGACNVGRLNQNLFRSNLSEKEEVKEFIAFNIILVIFASIVTKIFNTPLILSLLWLLLSNILHILQNRNRTRGNGTA